VRACGIGERSGGRPRDGAGRLDRGKGRGQLGQQAEMKKGGREKFPLPFLFSEVVFQIHFQIEF